MTSPVSILENLRSPEFELVTKLARKTLDTETTQAIRHLLSAELDLKRFFKLVYVNRVAPAVYQNLQNIGVTGMPETSMAWMAERIEQVVSGNKQREALLVEIAREFDRVELPFLVLKGPILANSIYGDPLLREYSDLDFLVDLDNLDSAMQLLNRFGFESLTYGQIEIDLLRRYHFEIHLQDAGSGTTIDLHWALVPPKWRAKPSSNEMWARAVDVHIGGYALHTLSPEDLLLYLTVHAAKDGWHRLRMLCDIAELLRVDTGWDWERTIAHAEASGCRRMLLVSALVVDQLLDAPVPDRVLALSRQEPEVVATCERIAQHLAIADERKKKPSDIHTVSTFQLRQFDRRRDRVLYTLQTLVTPRLAHVQFVHLPRSLVSLYPVVKILHDFLLMPLWRLVKVKQPQSLD